MNMQLKVDAVLTDGEQVLLIRRAKDPFQGKLAFPGGRVDPGETVLKAVQRELMEEVGIHLDEDDFTPLCVLDDPDRDPRPLHCAAHVFWARVTTDLLRSAKADSDAESIHVMSLGTIKSCVMAFDHYLAILKLKEVLG